MKTLIALLLVAAGLGAAYWKVQHPDATIDDLKAGANNTVERAKTGFTAFRDSSGGAGSAAKTAAVDEKISGLEASLNERLTSIESTTNSLDPTVINGRLTDSERRMDATDQKLGQISGSVDALAEEIDTVSSSLGNLNDNVAASAGEDQALTGRIDSLNTRLEALANDVNEQNAEQTLTNIGTRIDSMDTRLTELDSGNTEALGEFSAKLAGIADQSAAIESRINTLSVDASGDAEDSGNLRALVDQRLQEMESKLATANADALRMNTMVERLDAANAQIASIGAAQSEANVANDRVTALLKTLDANSKKTAVLESRLNDANEKIAEMTESLAILKTQSESNASVESLQAELNEQLELLKGRIENSTDSTDITTLNATLATTRNRIQSLEARVQNMPTDGDTSAAAQVAQSDLKEQFAAMEERLKALPQQTDPKLLNTLTQVQKQVAELRDRDTGDAIEYTVYFGLGSVGISDDAAKVLKSFIKQEQNRTTGVSIYGFTDRRGDASYNQRLALQRATAVRSYLIQNGFDYTKIKSLSGLGEDAAAATLADGAEDADQRAVVLVANQP